MAGPTNQPAECSREKAGQAMANGTTSKFISECNKAKAAMVKSGAAPDAFERDKADRAQGAREASARREVITAMPAESGAKFQHSPTAGPVTLQYAMHKNGL